MSSAFLRCLGAVAFLSLFTGSAQANCDKSDSILKHAYPQASATDDGYELKGKDYAQSINSDQIVCRAWPAKPGLTLAAVPLIEAHPDVGNDPRGDVELLVLDSNSNAVLARNVEKGAADSSAIAFDGVDLDVGRYDVKRGQRAFGLRVKISRSGSGSGISEEGLWLYTVDGHTITSLLKGLIASRSSGQDNGDCDSDREELKRVISVGKPGPSGFNDLIVQESDESSSTSKVGAECKDNTTSTPRTITLRFDGRTYAPVPGAPPAAKNNSLFSELTSPDAPAEPRTAQTPRPSFDCAKAASPVEKAICGSVNLSKQDKAVNDAYRSVLAQFDPAGAAALRADQAAFIDTRDRGFATRDKSSGPEVMNDQLGLRAQTLKKIDPRPAAGLIGKWDSIQANATITAKGDTYKLSLTTSDPLTGGSMCQIEAEGTLTGDTLVVNPGQTGWLVKARRIGSLLELTLEKPAAATAALPSFCAEGGRIGGLLFAQRATQ